MLKDDCLFLSRLPEHFAFSFISSLEPAEQLMALCALKQNVVWAQNDTVRSLDWYRALES